MFVAVVGVVVVVVVVVVFFFFCRIVVGVSVLRLVVVL